MSNSENNSLATRKIQAALSVGEWGPGLVVLTENGDVWCDVKALETGLKRAREMLEVTGYEIVAMDALIRKLIEDGVQIKGKRMAVKKPVDSFHENVAALERKVIPYWDEIGARMMASVGG